jgi:hypothetical protein
MSIDLGITPALPDDADLATMDRGDAVPGENVEVKDDADKLSAAESTPEGEEKPEGEDKSGAKDDKSVEDDRPRDDKGRFTKQEDEPRIPKSRFDEQMAREREQREAAERRAAELEAKLAESKTAEDLAEARTQLKEMIKQRNGFLADGELDKASEMDEKIFDFQNEVAAKQALHQANVAKEQAKEEIRYDALVSKLELDYPQINPDAEEFAPEVVKDIQAVMAGVQQTQRLSPSQALAKAVKLVLGDPKKEKAPVSENKAEEVGMRRKQEAVERNTKVADKQPPKTDKVGVDHDKVGGGVNAANIMKMTPDEFAKLSEEALAKMRGDYLS